MKKGTSKIMSVGGFAVGIGILAVVGLWVVSNRGTIQEKVNGRLDGYLNSGGGTDSGTPETENQDANDSNGNDSAQPNNNTSKNGGGRQNRATRYNSQYGSYAAYAQNAQQTADPAIIKEAAREAVTPYTDRFGFRQTQTQPYGTTKSGYRVSTRTSGRYATTPEFDASDKGQFYNSLRAQQTPGGFRGTTRLQTSSTSKSNRASNRARVRALIGR